MGMTDSKSDDVRKAADIVICDKCGGPTSLDPRKYKSGFHMKCPLEKDAEEYLNRYLDPHPKGHEVDEVALIAWVLEQDRARRDSLEDNIFINHILAHLDPGEEVICKVCGKTAKEICGKGGA